MLCRLVDMREKQVVCIKDGAILGYVSDFEIDTDSGKLRIQNTSKVVSEMKLDNKITCGAIGEKGNFAVSSITSNNQTFFTAYDKSGEEISFLLKLNNQITLQNY